MRFVVVQSEHYKSLEDRKINRRFLSEFSEGVQNIQKNKRSETVSVEVYTYQSTACCTAPAALRAARNDPALKDVSEF